LCDAIAHARRQKWIARSPARDAIAAVSVGRVNGRLLLDLNQSEDNGADVDLNLVMTGSGQLVEVQGTGEGASFTRAELDRMLRMGARGVRQLIEIQNRALRRRR
ncbi:MAG: ribonuclease PH, partial [Phycisphaerae bacterium]|nr:ribonuclease PH [Phycisphaerae bacterium]